MIRWDPWRGCKRYSEGCKFCYIHKGDAKRNINTNEERLIEVEGCFEFVGQDPSNEPLKNLDVINEKGYVLVDSQLETKVKGLFAAGDIIDKDVRQIVTAVNDGAIAALGASRYCK